MSTRLRSALKLIPPPAGVALSASLSFCAFAAVCVPAATASHEHEHGGGSVPAAAVAPATGSTGGAGSAAAPAPTSAQPATRAGHRVHSTGSSTPAQDAPSGSNGRPHAAGATPTGAAAPSRPASAGKRSRGPRYSAAGDGAGAAAAPGAAAALTPAAAPGSHGKGKGARTAEREAKVRERQEANGKRPRRSTAPPPSHQEASAGVSPSAGAAVPIAPATAQTATVATAPPAPSGRSQSTGSAPSRHAPAHPRGAAARRRAPAAVASAALAATLVPVAPSAAATSARARPHTRVSRARPQHGSTRSPLIGTVTRIIDVVPPLVRIVIAALVALALALAASARLATRRALRLARQREKLLEDVGLLQGALLPALPSRLGPVGTSAAYRPASGPGAGGDFYDVFALGDGQLAVIVGDVSGHGREALPHTTLVRFTLRAYLEAGLSPRGALQAAAAVLERQLGGSFATVVTATYDPERRTLTYACAGHPHPVFAQARALTPITACSSPPIGVGEPTGQRQTIVSLPGRALVCFHTDGVVESRVRGELFGAPRLRQTLEGLEAGATASMLLDSVAAQTDRRPDDMAACLLRLDGDGRDASVQVEELELEGLESAPGRAARFLAAAGLPPGEVHDVLNSVRSAVARHGRVVLALHLRDGRPEVVLRPQNVALLTPRTAASSRSVGISI